MEYYSAIKRNGILRHAAIWMNLKNMLSVSSQTKGHMLYKSFVWNIQNRQIHRERKKTDGCRDWERGEWGVTSKGYRVSLRAMEMFLELDNGDSCTALNALKCILIFILQKSGFYGMWIISQKANQQFMLKESHSARMPQLHGLESQSASVHIYSIPYFCHDFRKLFSLFAFQFSHL